MNMELALINLITKHYIITVKQMKKDIQKHLRHRAFRMFLRQSKRVFLIDQHKDLCRTAFINMFCSLVNTFRSQIA